MVMDHPDAFRAPLKGQRPMARQSQLHGRHSINRSPWRGAQKHSLPQ